jgi:two-component sensor histidine kinase/PAS domain-containing protein
VKREVVFSRIRTYVTAAAYVLLAAAAQFAVAQWVGRLESFAVFLPAIVAGALLGVGPGALGLGLSLAIGWSELARTAGPTGSGRGEALEFIIFGLGGAAVIPIVDAYRRRQPALGDVGHLFKAVQDISLEGVVVYRALIDRASQVRDFEYRYANPAARAIMVNRNSDKIVGAKLLDRLPLAREHPQLFPRYARVFTTGETSEAEYELGGRWFHSTAAKLDDGIVVTVQDVSARRRAEDAQRLRLQELNHRVKNLLASVVAMANATELGVGSASEFREKLSARLQALSRAHSLLMASAWTDAAVEDVVRNTLEPYLTTDASRFRIDGPRIRVSPDAALALNMALHELATNAMKYGALSGRRGRIGIRWDLDPDRPDFVLLTWSESDGPAVSKPNSSGFGTRLLQRAFAASDGGAQLHFLAGGLLCEMRFAGVIVRPQVVA